VGLWVNPVNYLDYVENLDRVHGGELEFVDSDKGYPVARLSGIELNFMHYKSEEEARGKYSKRFKRINHNKLLVKIDFGRPGYTSADIERWNRLCLPNSVALYPPSVEVPDGGIHNGVKIDAWMMDAAQMFDVTRRYFNIFLWIRAGKIRNGLVYRFFNFLLLDPTVPSRLGEQLSRKRGRTGHL
jgi:hypothetical protein